MEEGSKGSQEASTNGQFEAIFGFELKIDVAEAGILT
jgi:hypothetical protein